MNVAAGMPQGNPLSSRAAPSGRDRQPKERLMDRVEREHWLTEHAFHNVDAIVGAAEEGDRPTIQRCAALTLNESSGGFNVYGHEGASPELYGQGVTEENYKGIYIPNLWRGQNGIGPCQLTSAGYQHDANRLGGVWNAFCNCRVGFRLLHELIERYGVWAGAMHYNGSGPAAERYADEFVSHERALIAEGLR